MKKLPDWLHYIESLHPEAIALGLDRIRVVANRLNILNFSIPVVTITGTNGKGSCVAILESTLSRAGYRVGAYTSPHISRFNERIRINTIAVDDESLCAAFAQVEEARGETSLTYFEFTTLAALLLFKKDELDILLLEVGMGGRLDAVNIIDPTIAVITTVSLDHTEWLGNSRESIGFEKAGVMRAGKPIVCGDFIPPHCIIEKAKILKSPLYLQNQDYRYEITNDNWQWECADWQLTNLPLPKLPIQNMATALMVIKLLAEHFTIPELVLRECLQTTIMPGRFQYHKNNFILDVAHNPAAAQWLKMKLAALNFDGKLHALVGMLADKDIENTFKPLKSVIHFWHVCELHVKRGASTKLLQEKLRNIGITDYKAHNSIADGVKYVANEKNKNDIVIIFGSFHTISGALQVLNGSEIT